MPGIGNLADLTEDPRSNLVELLELCKQFLRAASPAVSTKLLAFLAGEPNRRDAD